MIDTLTRLAAVIAERRGASAETSYVAALHARGLAKIAQKVGEEAVETVIAALADDPAALTGEAADLLFHLLVLLDARGVALADVLAELDRRDGLSGLAEKAQRKRVPPTPAPAAPQPDAVPDPVAVPLPMMGDGEPLLALGREAPPRPRIRKG